MDQDLDEHIPPMWAKVALAVVICATVVGAIAIVLLTWLGHKLEEARQFD